MKTRYSEKDKPSVSLTGVKRTCPITKTDRRNIVVVGAGLNGASTTLALLQRGFSVSLIESGDQLNDLSSSTGCSRIIRPGDEHKEYPKWVNQSTSRWVENDAFEATTSISIVPKNSDAYARISSSNPVQDISRKDLIDRGFEHLPKGLLGLGDAWGAVINPEKLLTSLYQKIQTLGGDIRFNTSVKAWSELEEDDISIRVINKQDGVEKIDEIKTSKMVLTANAWTPKLLQMQEGENTDQEVIEELSKAFYVRRVPLYWTNWPEGVPETIFREPLASGHGDLYAMPERDKTGTLQLKFGFHLGDGIEYDDPDTLSREVSEEEKIYALRRVQKLFGKENITGITDTKVCLYSMTRKPPEYHLEKEVATPIIGSHPATNNVVIGAGFCGNGAKFAPFVGDIISHMAVPFNDRELSQQSFETKLLMAEAKKAFSPTHYLPENVKNRKSEPSSSR